MSPTLRKCTCHMDAAGERGEQQAVALNHSCHCQLHASNWPEDHAFLAHSGFFTARWA